MSNSAFAFFCPVCNKKYIVSADLRQHINLEHCIYMEPRIYVFSCKSHHRKRLKNAIDPEFPHACPICHKRFASEAYLEIHVEGAHFIQNCMDFRFACAKPGCEKVYEMEEWKEICLVDREVEMNEDIDIAEWSVRLKSFYPAYKQRRDSLEGTAVDIELQEHRI